MSEIQFGGAVLPDVFSHLDINMLSGIDRSIVLELRNFSCGGYCHEFIRDIRIHVWHICIESERHPGHPIEHVICSPYSVSRRYSGIPHVISRIWLLISQVHGKTEHEVINSFITETHGFRLSGNDGA